MKIVELADLKPPEELKPQDEIVELADFKPPEELKPSEGTRDNHQRNFILLYIRGSY